MKKVYLFAIIMALITGFSVYAFTVNLKKTTSRENMPMTSVVVAATNIGENTVITEKMLVVKQLPVESVTAGTAAAVDVIIGKIVKYPILAGEQIIVQQLKTLGSDDGTDLSYQLKDNERAMTISVDEITGISGFIRQGDTVDILTTTSSDNSKPVTSYLLQNVRVLKVSNKAANISGQTITSYNSVTLCLSADDSLKLGEAINLGKSIRLVLRPITGTSKTSS